MCSKVISTTYKDSHIRREVVGVAEYWCSASCYNTWLAQNMVFVECADPFARRVYTNSEHRRSKE